MVAPWHFQQLSCRMGRTSLENEMGLSAAGMAVGNIARKQTRTPARPLFLSTFRDWRKHLLLAINECRSVITGVLEAVTVRDGIGRTGFDAISAKNAAVVVDVVYGSVALAAADALRIRVFRGLDINATRRAGRRAQETSHTLFQAVLIAL